MELFADTGRVGPSRQEIADGAVILRRFALPEQEELLYGLAEIVAKAPFRHLITPGGYRMSVAMTNCGRLGWVSDRRGYRYDAIDRVSGRRWPEMPPVFKDLATRAAASAGYEDFLPDACLINQYEPGTRMSLHQDKNEIDLTQPIVSVSLGIPAVFQFGGMTRAERPERIPLQHGDVAVWGGSARLRFHGILKLTEAEHPLCGRRRINLTFRRAGGKPPDPR
jgi:alkylated DNA repair protein (DNA oxidative demethylase)